MNTMKIWERIIGRRLIREETTIGDENNLVSFQVGTTDAIFAVRQLTKWRHIGKYRKDCSW